MGKGKELLQEAKEKKNKKKKLCALIHTHSHVCLVYNAYP